MADIWDVTINDTHHYVIEGARTAADAASIAGDQYRNQHPDGVESVEAHRRRDESA